VAVKRDPGHQPTRRTQAERREATRGALVLAARELFAAKGFAGAGREEIVERAGVTRGAMYHHFASKEDLFLAVFEAVEADVMRHVATAAMASDDPLEQLRLGSLAYLEVAADPAVSRVCLVDAPAVLSPDARREVTDRYATGMVREALAGCMASGRIAAQPVEPLTHIVLAAVLQAATLVAEGSDAGEVGGIVERMLDGLR
jgi:AcrR family transcriptional regulator